MPLTITIGEPKFGNGFYLNVPDAKSYVILTAAHNLIDDNGNPSKELHVVRREGDKGDRIPPTNLTTFVCPDYKPSATKGRPKGTTADSDYGVLLTPKPSEASKDGGRSYIGIGFGFALKLSHEDLCGANLDLCGYVSQEEKANAQDSLDARSGLCLDASDGSLEYDMHTMPGLSGSPIFKGYKGHETVVAIQ
jgi:V8-like Glu-specific endopeptidase